MLFRCFFHRIFIIIVRKFWHVNKTYKEVFYASILTNERNISEFKVKIQHEKDQKGFVTSPFSL